MSQADNLIMQMQMEDELDSIDHEDQEDHMDCLINHRNNCHNAGFVQSRESIELIKGLINEMPNRKTISPEKN